MPQSVSEKKCSSRTNLKNTVAKIVANLNCDKHQLASMLMFLSALKTAVSNGHLTDPGNDFTSHFQEFRRRFATFSSSSSAQEFDTAALQSIWQIFCDRKLEQFWSSETVIGNVYQLACIPNRKLSQNSLESANKTLTHDRLIAFTQLYTPEWVCQFLLTKCIAPQWTSVGAKDFRLIDPACGAGHFLLPAYDLLQQLYKNDGYSDKESAKSILENNLFGCDIDPLALQAAALSLFVKTLPFNKNDELQFNNLANVQSTSSLLGSLERAWPANHNLSRSYHCVVANPPYIGRKLLDRQLKTELKNSYPRSANDLCAAFLERAVELLEPNGRLGMITQASLLHLPSYKHLRHHLLSTTNIETIVEAGPNVFPLQSGEKVNSMLFIAQRPAAEVSPTSKITFIDLTKTKNKADALSCHTEQTHKAPPPLCHFERGVLPHPESRNLPQVNDVPRAHEEPPYAIADFSTRSQSSLARNDNVYAIPQKNFLTTPNYQFNYKCPAFVLEKLTCHPPLTSIAEIKQGLATTDNKRFLRYWWEVDANSIGQDWFPYIKGAGVKRWQAGIKHLVNWQDGGREIKEAVVKAYPYLNGKAEWVVKNEQYYFRKGLTFSFIGPQDFSVRLMPAGCIFDVAGSAIFTSDADLMWLLAYLNSSFIRAVVRTINPSINFQVGDLKRLPVIEFTEAEKSQLAQSAQTCCAIQNIFLSLDPTNFQTEPPVEVKNALAGADIDEQWLQLSSRLQTAQVQLHTHEQLVDDLVLTAVFRCWTLNDVEIKTLSNWIINETKRDSEVHNFSKESFAQLVVYHASSN